MKLTTKALCITIGALLCLNGCSTMAPKYSQPAAPVTAAWPNGPSYKDTATTTDKAVADIPWKEFFVDLQLGGKNA